jgi:ribosomal protein L37AE/L43A
MSFKPKTQKKIKIDKKSIITVDNKHDEFIDKFKQNEFLIENFEDEISMLKECIQNKHYKGVEERLSIIDKIRDLKIKKTRLKKEKSDYFLNQSKYLFDYFENKKSIGQNNNNKKILHNFFNKNKNVKKFDIDNDSSKQYLMQIDNRFIDINNYTENYEKCKKCNGELVIIDYDGIMVCKRCSHQEKYLIEHEKPSYKEPPKEVDSYAYKRINHFREILAQFQAKESTQIDDSIIEQIREKVKKERITIDKLTNDKTKQILKNLGYNKYYEHIPFIKEKLGIRPPTMPIELETKLCNLFLEIQRPYAKFCPIQRVNFLNYYYVLYKLCELLGEDQYLKHFYMLKDPIKRMEQDEIWKKICAELKWEFIPTP